MTIWKVTITEHDSWSGSSSEFKYYHKEADADACVARNQYNLGKATVPDFYVQARKECVVFPDELIQAIKAGLEAEVQP